MTLSEIARNIHSILKVLHPELVYEHVIEYTMNEDIQSMWDKVMMTYENFTLTIDPKGFTLFCGKLTEYVNTKSVDELLDIIEENNLC